MSDVANIKIGACSIMFGAVDLGHTKGGVTVNYSPEYSEITADQYGKTIIDRTLIGEKLTVKVPLAETQVANLAKVIPLGTLAGTNKRLTLGKDAGARLASAAAVLVLHPLVNAANNRDDDVVIYKAVVSGEVELNYNVEDERVMEVEFEALIDTSKSNGSYLGIIGDSAAA
jgi:hypothetical protein